MTSSCAVPAQGRRYKGPLLQGPRYEIDLHSTMYPESLRDLDDAPRKLYVVGNPYCLEGGLSVVGARKATPYGLSCASRFASLAAERGVVIVSGGAKGCDSAAHTAALDSRGSTVVVLGGGCDELYPAAHAGLFQQVIDGGGAVISEHEWGFPPVPYAFRMRNRIIAALSRATLIVEAGLPSGTFSAADEALQIGREVLVVPGAITSPTSLGSNRLLYQGAFPVVDDASFIELLSSVYRDKLMQQERGAASVAALRSGQANPLLDDELIRALLAQPMDSEAIYSFAKQACGGEDPSAWAAVRLEDAQDCGLIARYPDGRYGAYV